jgi:hypothetical protein
MLSIQEFQALCLIVNRAPMNAAELLSIQSIMDKLNPMNQPASKQDKNKESASNEL